MVMSNTAKWNCYHLLKWFVHFWSVHGLLYRSRIFPQCQLFWEINLGVLYLKEDFLGPKLGRFPGISLQGSLDLGNLQSLLSILPFIKLFSFRYFLTVMEILVTQTSGKQYLLDQKKKRCWVPIYRSQMNLLIHWLINWWPFSTQWGNRLNRPFYSEPFLLLEPFFKAWRGRNSLWQGKASITWLPCWSERPKGHPELTVIWDRSQNRKHFFFLQFKFLHQWICFSSYLLLVWDFSVSLTHLYSLSKLSGIGRAQSLKNHLCLVDKCPQNIMYSFNSLLWSSHACPGPALAFGLKVMTG